MTTRPKVGDHLLTPRIGYSHHGICIGRERIVHYSGLANGLTAGRVQEVSLDEFCGGRNFKIIPHPSRKYGPRASANRANGRIDENEYHVITNNCEHFVNWCIEGESRSEQTDFRIEHLPDGMLVAVIGLIPYAIIRRIFD